MKAFRFCGFVLVAMAAFGLFLVSGCSSDHTSPVKPPVAIQSGDISEGCGMAITGSPGPRAEAYVGEQGSPLKFGSVRDFFAYVLQPENSLRVRGLYVQDTAKIDWRHPSDAASSFVDARSAYYVAWQPLIGMMGPTFAPFSTRDHAVAFVHEHGGQVLRFDDVTVAIVAGLGTACPTSDSPLHKLAADCKAPADS